MRRQLISKVLPICIGLVIGGGLSWWITSQQTPWLEFDKLTSTYQPGAREIQMVGEYTVHRPCDGEQNRLVIWRTEALATDGQIALYGPKPDMPPMTVGTHVYSAPITLQEAILPDGWRTSVIITCAGANPETVASPSALVTILRGGPGREAP